MPTITRRYFGGAQFTNLGFDATAEEANIRQTAA
jgi:hypothetical protein